MKKKLILSAATVAVMSVASIAALNSNSQARELSEIEIANIEALTEDENSGAKCPNGCSDIGWGWDKILECDCEYDHFSTCNKWGC